jgi:hypothetical protein
VIWLLDVGVPRLGGQSLYRIVGCHELHLGLRGMLDPMQARCPVNAEGQVRRHAIYCRLEFVLICCVMIVNPEISFAFHSEAHMPVLGERVVHLHTLMLTQFSYDILHYTHMVKKSDSSRHIDHLFFQSWVTVKLDFDFDLRLARFPRYSCGTKGFGHGGWSQMIYSVWLC